MIKDLIRHENNNAIVCMRTSVFPFQRNLPLYLSLNTDIYGFFLCLITRPCLHLDFGHANASRQVAWHLCLFFIVLCSLSTLGPFSKENRWNPDYLGIPASMSFSRLLFHKLHLVDSN